MTLETSSPSLIWGAKPEVRAGVYVLVRGAIPPQVCPLGSVTSDGVRSTVITKVQADAAGLGYPFAAAWITVRLHSAAKAARLTAAVVEALAVTGIRCVVVAGFAHNHLFVPHAQTEDTLAVLSGMSQGGAFH